MFKVLYYVNHSCQSIPDLLDQIPKVLISEFKGNKEYKNKGIVIKEQKNKN